MRAVVQRVKYARVTVEGNQVGEIGRGIVILLGVHSSDTAHEADSLAYRCAELRIFDDGVGRMNRSLRETGGSALVVSQFTLYGDCSRGRRPSFTEAASPDAAKGLYDYFIKALREFVVHVETGVFGASMELELINDGPVTLIIERRAPLFQPCAVS